MELINILTLIIGGSGLAGAGVTIYQVRKNSSSAAATTEVEAAAQESADWASFTKTIQAQLDYQDRKIAGLENRIVDLQKNHRAERQAHREERQADLAHIDLLNYWILNELGPPPPKRGGPYPDTDQVGG